MQDVLLTDGVFVFSAFSGHSSGCLSAWTAVTTHRLFAADADKSNMFSQLIAVEKTFIEIDQCICIYF